MDLLSMQLLWTGWPPIIHTLVLGSAGYVALVMLLRVTGARTMAKMTPLDFVVAVTLGSAFGRTVTAVDVPLAQAVVALALLIALQWLLATGRANFRWVRRAVDPPPVLLWYEGELITATLRKHQLTQTDVHTAAREAGHGSLDGLRAVIMQQDGSLGVIADGSMGDGSTVLPYTEGAPRAERT
ncbi:MAG: YetF domain-containing protein [Ornithinimicrobium sp.]